MARERLEDHVCAVIQVGGEHEGRVEAEAGAPVVIVVCDQGLPHGVQAVDLVEDFDFGHVRGTYGAQVPVRWGDYGFIWVFAKADHVGAGNGVDADVADAVPGCVDFGRWREAVDVRGIGGVGEHGCVGQFRDEGNIETVEHWGF